MPDWPATRRFVMRRTVHSLLSVGLLVFAVGGALAADVPAASVGRPGSQLLLSKFYVGPLGHTGTFRGKLVCLRCDLKPSALASQKCAAEGCRHALAIDDDSMIHPLVAGTEETSKRINSSELHGKDVEVHGNYYPSTGMIFVDRVELAQ
jgi:hypothetical protein